MKSAAAAPGKRATAQPPTNATVSGKRLRAGIGGSGDGAPANSAAAPLCASSCQSTALEDEAAKLAWRRESEAAIRSYNERWLAERLPSDGWLAAGAQHAADPTKPIFRIVGELSACQLMARRLGAPTDASAADISAAESELSDAAWRRIRDADWMDPIIEHEVMSAPDERKAGVREELRELQLDLQFSEPQLGEPLLRRFAQAMYPCKDDLGRCHGWDAHLRRGGPCSKVEVVGRLLATALDLVIQEGLLEGYRQLECPIDYHSFVADATQQQEGRVTWRSLHPCSHWVCEACAVEWIHVRLRTTCPTCRAPIQFTRRLERSW